MGKSIHNISIVLNADMEKGMSKIKMVEREMRDLEKQQIFLQRQGLGRSPVIDARLAELRELAKEAANTSGILNSVGTGTAARLNGHNAALKSNGKLQQSFGQLSFAVEDFMSVYDTMGLRGGMRASANNLSMVARIMSGPLAGGIVGVGAMLLPMLVDKFNAATEASKHFGTSLDRSLAALRRQQEMDNFEYEIKLKIDTASIKNFDDLPAFASMKNQATGTINRIKELKRNIDDLQEKQTKLSSSFALSQDMNVGISFLNKAARDGKLSYEQLNEVVGMYRKAQLRFVEDLSSGTMKQERAVSNLKRSYENAEQKAISLLKLGLAEVRANPTSMMLTHASLTAEAIKQGAGETDELLKLIRKVSEEMSAVVADETAIANLKKQVLETMEKQEDIAKKIRLERTLLIEEEKKLRASALKELLVAGDNDMQALFRKIREEQLSLQKTFEGTGRGPLASKLLEDANSSLLQKTIDKLKSSLDENTKENKKTREEGGTASGPTFKDASRAATIEALKILSEQQDEDEDEVKDNAEVVAAIKSLETALLQNSFVAIPTR